MGRIILIAALLAVTIAGCNRFPDLTMQITANLAPDESQCTIDANQELILFRGFYDLEIQRNYVLTPRIESYLVDNSLDIQAVSQNIQITSFDVTLKLPDGSVPDLGALPNPYRVTTTSVIPPSETEGLSQVGAAAANVIPSTYYDVLVAIEQGTEFNSIVLDVRANGETSGGFSQQSPPFSWPVEFCRGCLGAICEPPLQVGDGVGCLPGQDIWTYCAVIVDPDAEAATP